MSKCHSIIPDFSHSANSLKKPVRAVKVWAFHAKIIWTTHVFSSTNEVFFFGTVSRELKL